VHRCLANLLSNAVKFTMAGSVRIAARRVPGPESGSRHIEISVEDTGIGMEKEDMDRIFLPFSRLESAKKLSIPGTGLGLYLTKKLLTEVLGGTIKVRSSVGEGSTFKVIISEGSEA